MAYFNGVKPNDRVYDLVYGWGRVLYTLNHSFHVGFEDENIEVEYDYDGKEHFKVAENQRLFWDEVKFEIPEPPERDKIELTENKFEIDVNDINPYVGKIGEWDEDYIKGITRVGLARNDRETAEKALRVITRFIKLLALRDEVCLDSRGYEFIPDTDNWYIFKQHSDYDENYFFNIDKENSCNDLCVYFRTQKDVQKVCDILNSGKFSLE